MTSLLESSRVAFEALPAALRVGRRQAQLQAALAEGLPLRAERWKYTSLRALGQRSFVSAAAAPTLDPGLLADIPAPRLVFVNGRFETALSQCADLPAGLRLHANSGDVAADEAPALPADAVFQRLALALATDGANIEVEPGRGVDTPLHLVFVGTPVGADLACHLRHRISLGAGSSLHLVEHHRGQGLHRHLFNHFAELELGEDARLQLTRIQDEAEGASLIQRSDARLAARAELVRLDLELGGALARNEIAVRLQGDAARLRCDGVLLATQRRHLDTRLDIVHAARDTHCELNWRGLAGGRGRIAFHGGILIEAGADGSEAALANKNLLLSEQAEIDSQPVLEIHADEVKAAHGATVGQLDGTALFYLRSRGIEASEARRLLTRAFCHEVLGNRADPNTGTRLDAALDRLESPA